jgi:PAS domain S-box-containing protein
LLDNAPDIIARYGSDLRLLYINRTVETLLGIPRASIFGKRVSEIAEAPNENVQRWEDTIGDVIESGELRRMEFSVGVPLIAPSEQRHFEVSVTPEFDGEGRVCSVVSITRDITDRVEAERMLRDSEARHTAIVTAALDCIITIDVNERILEWNPACVETFGYSRDEALGRELSLLIVPERLRGAHTRGIQHFLATGEGPALFKRVEVPALRANGEEFLAELTALPIKRGDTYIFTAYLRDLSEREQIAAQRRTLLRDMLLSVTDGKLTLCHSDNDLPPSLEPVSELIDLSAKGGIAQLRQATENASDKLNIPSTRCADFVSAVSEAAMNAVIHGGGGTGRVFADAESGRIQVRVIDHGAGIPVDNLPQATLARGFSTASTLGHGLKMIVDLIDRVYLLTGTSGTTVVLGKERNQPLPPWLE